jgi:hypothetical protein|tara:strand:+ start:3604 stop:4830 length:1227 start_codon:yes stop_codon:yes gene_type:complete
MKKKKKNIKRYKVKKKSVKALRKKKPIKILRKKNIKKSVKKKKRKNLKNIKKNSRKKILKKTNSNKRKKRINASLKFAIVKVFNVIEDLKSKLNFNINLDQELQSIFQGISNKISSKINDVKLIIDEEKERKKQIKIKEMQQEKVDNIKKIKIEKQISLENKKKELKEEIRFEKERKKDLQKFIRIEQAEVRKEQAEKQKKFLEQIRLEKKIEQFRKREALEIKNLEKYVLSQERESYAGVQERIDLIKKKYQSLRDQKIRQRIEELGIEVTDSDTRSELLEKERQYNSDRLKIEFALESYYRSMASCVFQLNKRWIPKKMSLLRVLDYRYERSEIFIKFDEDEDEKWLMLVYIKDNNPDAGIIVEDKTKPEKNVSIEYQSNEIFKFSDALVDSLTNLLDRKRKKKVN